MLSTVQVVYSLLNFSLPSRRKTRKMSSELQLYNTVTKQKEVFQPLVEGRVGVYVCGPTVYSDVHLGNCLTFTRLDVIYRYLK